MTNPNDPDVPAEPKTQQDIRVLPKKVITEVYGVKIEQGPIVRCDDKLNPVLFTSEDIGIIKAALLELRKKLMERNWHFESIVIK